MPSVSLEELWDREKFKPNSKQREAIAAIEGPLYLTAGPGSGKTRVLLWRTLNLIVFHGADPKRIFLGTFTEKAAHQLREGLRGLLGTVTEVTGRPFDISSMSIGTVHSICHSILLRRELAPAGRHRDVPFLLDELDQFLFLYAPRLRERLLEVSGLDYPVETINEYLRGRPTKSNKSNHDLVTGLVHFFNRCSEESINPDTVKVRGDRVLRALVKMYGEYRKVMLENVDRKVTDLSLLQDHAFRRITDSPEGSRLFDHVIVDEYQDTNSVQEKIYFRLAERTTNLCIVGDDDQALYRFRGATVDNFLAFPERCIAAFGRAPRTIDLVRNYRSRKNIVKFYNRFIAEYVWKVGAQTYRVPKTIGAQNTDDSPAVFAATPATPLEVADEVADVVKDLITQQRVKDASEIAFLFPSLNSTVVEKMRDALEERGLEVYAPRAGSFIEVPESLAVFGIFLLIFGNPGHYYSAYRNWLGRATEEAKRLVRGDATLARFVKDRQEEIERAAEAEMALLKALKLARIPTEAAYDDRAKKIMLKAKAGALVDRFLLGGNLKAYIDHQRRRRPDRPITVRYIINRACSLDWGVLDLFYRLTTFKAFKAAFDLAEQGTDEGAICNLSLISDYLARFQEQTSPVITAQFLSNRGFARRFFSSYLYAIYRLGEGEYEDKEDPFPKGRIPFLTIHQAKGLEFPVVVLGNLRKDRKMRVIDTLMRKLGVKRLEPSEQAVNFDIARMFYVALSRPQQLLILCPFKGSGQRINDEFRAPIEELAQPLSKFRPALVDPNAKFGQGEIPHPYSFTGDYIGYKICPRRYMMYRRYNFTPSRSQTMVFGNLVHRTIEDLHQWLIQERRKPSNTRTST